MGRRTVFFYALPGIAFAMPTIPVYVFLPAHYAGALGLGLTATGAVLLAARIFDVVTDPLVGYASDRMSTRWGRRKPLVVIGAVIAAISLIKLLDPPAEVSAAYLIVWVMLLYLGWTLIAVPYTAWGAEISPDYHERSRFAGAREAAMLVGVIAAAAIPSAADSLGVSEGEALAMVAWLAVAIGAPTVALLLWRVPEGAVSTGGSRSLSELYRSLPAIASNGPFMRLLAAWFVNGLANGFPAVLFPLYLKHVLGATGSTVGVFILAYFLCGMLAIPVWLALSRRYGKHRVWCAAMLAACAAFIWVPMVEAGAFGGFFVICIITGMALGADLALPPAMQADVVDYDTLREGHQRAGLFFAFWSMATKLALAVAVGIAFPLLDLFGFDPNAAANTRGLGALVVIYAIVPTVLKLCAVAMIWGHPLTAQRHRAIRRRLDSRSRRLASEIAQ